MLPFDSFSAMDHFEGTRPGHLLALFSLEIITYGRSIAARSSKQRAPF
jgi:hypothetical protein